jgi:hypothetical protein
VAARTLDKAAQPARFQALPTPAPTRTPWGDTVVSKEEPATLEQLPDHVRRAVTQVAQGRAVTDHTLEKRIRNGQPIHEAEFSIDGVEHELKVDEQGKIFESEIEFAISDVPTPVTGGIQTVMPGAVLLTAEREQIRDNPAFFEIHVLHGGRRYEVQVAEDGRMLRTSPR